MTKHTLRNIDGKPIRRQYFTAVVVMHYILMLFIPWVMLVVSLSMHRFDPSKWLSDLWISVWVCFGFSLPWLLLRALNRRFFGRIVCVLSADGIHHPSGKIGWDEIEKIEYVVDHARRYKRDPANRCRAIIYTQRRQIALLHAPLCILSEAKKYKPGLVTRIAGTGKAISTLLAVAGIILLCPLLILLPIHTHTPTAAQIGVFLGIDLLLYVICLPLFHRYAIDYRFWCRILPRRALFWVAYWFLLLSTVAVLLLVWYCPAWWLVILGGMYLGAIGPLSPLQSINGRPELLSRERLHDIYITNAAFWERNRNKKREKKKRKP